MWRFLRRLLGLDHSECRCVSGTHGHAPSQCRKGATRSGGLCASCFEKHLNRHQHDRSQSHRPGVSSDGPQPAIVEFQLTAAPNDGEQSDMLVRTISLTAIVCLVSGYAAAACEVLAANPGESPLETRRPARGDEVRLTSGFGMRRHPLLGYEKLHTGVDWAAPVGTPVHAAGAGRVVIAKWQGEYGNAIAIDHGGGWQTFYSQLSAFDVREGECVTLGTLIGKVGTTGLSAGPHLHFEVRQDGRPIDPMSVQLKTQPPKIEDKKQ